MASNSFSILRISASTWSYIVLGSVLDTLLCINFFKIPSSIFLNLVQQNGAHDVELFSCNFAGLNILQLLPRQSVQPAISPLSTCDREGKAIDSRVKDNVQVYQVEVDTICGTKLNNILQEAPFKNMFIHCSKQLLPDF